MFEEKCTRCRETNDQREISNYCTDCFKKYIEKESTFIPHKKSLYRKGKFETYIKRKH